MKNKTILIADDEAIMRKNLKEVLSEEGFQLVEATDGRDAVTKACTLIPPVMLLDINMPPRRAVRTPRD